MIVQMNTPRVMIAGTSSGCGKTTVTCAVLEALKNRGAALRSFKCGPDYIDPMFHSKILGIPCRNLDSYLCSERTVKHLFSRSAPAFSTCVIEGVMGYYDGLGGNHIEASSHHIARILDVPVILVANCRGKSLSLAAELQGFLRFAPNSIRGIILNGAAQHTYGMYKSIVESHAGIPVLGYLPWVPEAKLESRHLGLVTAQEIGGLRRKMQLLAEQAEKTIDLNRILELARSAKPVPVEPVEVERLPSTVRIAIARDSACSFYYQDNLDLLELLGAKLLPFSPLGDSRLPQGASGLLLGGGYPELYARILSINRPMMNSIREAVAGGMPTIAECGGFMLLCRSLVIADGTPYAMAGVIDTDIRMTSRLGRFGYANMVSRKNNLLCDAGEQMRTHEFHYSEAENPGGDFHLRKSGGSNWKSGYGTPTMYAGYQHLHLWNSPRKARRYMERCMEYQRRKGVGTE